MLTRPRFASVAATLALGLAAIVIAISTQVRAGPPPPVTALDNASIRAAGRTIDLRILTVQESRLLDPTGPGLAPPARILAAAPDGSAVAVSRVDRGQVGPLTIARMDGSQLDVELPGVRGAAFDASGAWLAVVDLGGALWRVDAPSGAASQLADGPFGSAPAVLADGRVLAIRLSSVDAPTWADAVVVDPSIGEETPVAASTDGQDQLVYQATPLSDGSMALVRHRPGGGVSLAKVRADGSEAWLAELEDASQVAVSPDGRWLAWATSGRLRISRMDRGRLTRDLGDGTGVRFSTDSSLMLLFNATETRVVDLNGNAVTQVGASGVLAGRRPGVPAMTVRNRLSVVFGVLVAFVSATGRVAAADDFTLPFYSPSTVLSYGVDRDPRPGYQLDWTGQLWHDSVPHWGRVYDQHSGLDYPMPVQTAVAAARDGTVIDLEEAYGTTQFGDYGNFVRVRHPDGRETLYYHLAQNGALVGMSQPVSAGQPIGLSGCSGPCYGAHLHFELLRYASGWKSVDPLADRLWTTWPGRVPFLASYWAESNPYTVVIRRGTTVYHWVEFRNTGGRTWLRDEAWGRLVLGTWNPPWRTSGFRASDWPAYWVPTYLDQAAVAPDGVGRFTFGLRAPWTVGSYQETFNLLSDPVMWFDHARLGGYYVPIYVTSGQQP